MRRDKQSATTPTDNPNAFSRRRFIQGSVAAAAEVFGLNQSTPLEAAQSLALPNGFKGKRPNFLILMCDEMRFPPVYESAETKKFLISLSIGSHSGLRVTRSYRNLLRSLGYRGKRLCTRCYPSVKYEIGNAR